MNATIIHKPNVTEGVLDELAKELPAIIAEAVQVTGARLALLKPKQISLGFSLASLRDVGADVRIMIFARSNDPRTETEDERAQTILEKVLALIANSDEKYTVDIRLYLMKIGAAEHPPG